ncbi:HBL/NHE enterotoxin family protein [Bacillus wiedmannii]|uniref:HBL/NHE enterotoxin family protein n=1 Tax=Bacillus wiedmannii TaxID=1890302 RepID=UPI000BF13AC3|nr:HBL/NHE enterotoxin family protein [Bacillus wiedmannii]MDP1459871.1 HBL/NHE enterotoxin family protein [Bacillus wiedmannii]PEJ65620.1 hemolysin BL lytic component L2 [Bacillus wiedmannii]
MKSRVIKGFLVTSFLTGGALPICTFATPIALAEIQQENVDLSLSLGQLGNQSKYIQFYVDEALKRPNVQLADLPALQADQILIKQDMQEWSSELYPHLILLNAKSKGFTTKFNSYYPNLKQFIDSKEDQQGFLDRLEALQDIVQSNQDKIQSHINELQYFQSQLTSNMTNLNSHVDEGIKILGGSKDQRNTDLNEARTKIQKDLQELALIPGALNAQGFEIFKDVYSLTKEMINPAAEAAMAAINKGKEIENSIAEAEKAAETAAKEANKSTQEIEAAKKEAREKIEKDKKNDIAAAAAAKAQEYDLLKAFDTDKIQKVGNSFAEMNKLSAAQQEKLADLQIQNKKIYDLTKQMTIVDVQKTLLNQMQNGANTFTDKVKLEVSLLETHKKDWEQVKNCIKQLSTNTSDSKVQSAQLKRLKDLTSQLEEQMNRFDS